MLRGLNNGYLFLTVMLAEVQHPASGILVHPLPDLQMADFILHHHWVERDL
jgi:hypothetical protein